MISDEAFLWLLLSNREFIIIGSNIILYPFCYLGCSSLHHFFNSFDAPHLKVNGKKHSSWMVEALSRCLLESWFSGNDGLSGTTNPVSVGVRISATGGPDCSRATVAFQSGVHSVSWKGDQENRWHTRVPKVRANSRKCKDWEEAALARTNELMTHFTRLRQ